MKHNNMKRILGSATLALLLGSSFAMGASIIGSKHDLSVGAQGSSDNGQVCVYCHTPHASNTAMTAAPLWNKPYDPAAVTFQMYGTTIAGTQTAAAPSMVSLACLTCHDGVSAMNAVVNAPGSGAGNGTIGNPGTMSGIAAIGADDLTNDHPISIDYIPGRASLVPLDTPLSGGGWGDYTTVSDLLRNGKVECGSCHDVHDKQYGTFLRNTNVGSALCVTCHAK